MSKTVPIVSPVLFDRQQVPGQTGHSVVEVHNEGGRRRCHRRIPVTVHQPSIDDDHRESVPPDKRRHEPGPYRWLDSRERIAQRLIDLKTAPGIHQDEVDLMIDRHRYPPPENKFRTLLRFDSKHRVTDEMDVLDT